MQSVRFSFRPFAAALFFTAVLAPAPKAFAVCALPNGAEGQVIYNGAYKVVQFCDGANWIAMGAGSGAPGGSNAQLQFNDNGLLAGAAQLSWDKANNRLGVGTAAPGARLHIDGAGELLRLTSGSFGTLYAGTDTNQPWIGTSTNNDLRFVTNAISQVYIKASGNVGIGTSAPARKFVVASPTQMKLGTAQGALFSDMANDGGVIVGSDFGIGSIQGTNAAGTAARNLMLQAEGGNVGVGTATPATIVDIRGKLSVPEIAFKNADGGDDSDPYRLRKYQTSSNVNELQLHLNDDSNERFAIYGNSCVGASCGEYSPNLYHYFRTDGVAYHAGSVLAPSYCRPDGSYCFDPYWGWWVSQTWSDQRLKKNIKPLEETAGLEAVMKLRPVRFEWRDETAAKTFGPRIGLVAQEVEKILPEVVETPPMKREFTEQGKKITLADPKNIDYQALVVPLIKAVQELKSDNDALRAALEAANTADREHTQAIEDLRAQIKAMRASIH